MRPVDCNHPKHPNCPRSEHYVLTFYDYDNIDASHLVFTTLPKGVTYLVYGYEICPKTKRPHLQGYVQFNTKVKKCSMEQIFWPPIKDGRPGWWSKAARGDDEEAGGYCFGGVTAQKTKDINTRVVELGIRRELMSAREKKEVGDYMSQFIQFIKDERLAILKHIHPTIYPNLQKLGFKKFYQRIDNIQITESNLDEIYRFYFVRNKVRLSKSQREEINFYFKILNPEFKKFYDYTFPEMPDTELPNGSLELIEDF